MGGGGVDGCIHSAAGSFLKKECTLLDGCETGDAKITSGYKLPAKHVIHTVGPIGENQSKLKSCYERCLMILKENKLRSLAMPCVSTGVYGYPGEKAAQVAIQTVRDWLETDKNADLVDRIIFCLFLKNDVRLYEEWMPVYFPVDDSTSKESNVQIEEEESKLSESKSSPEDRSPKAKIAKTEEHDEAKDVSKETSVSQGSDAEKAGAENDKSNTQSAETLKEEGARETEDGSNGGSVGEDTVTKDETGSESAVLSPDAVEESTDKEVATGVKEVTTGVEEVTTGVKEATTGVEEVSTGVKEGTEAKDEATEVKEEMAEGKDVTPEEQSQSEQTKTEECSTTSKDTEITDQENGDPEKERLESKV
ncbi:ADP-ribose glycohydrolase MACROD2-like isoform X2 [Ptychodera flava]